MAEVVKTTFRLRRGDIKTWEENNPVLKKGEPGVAYENGRVKCLKIGDGISPWNKLKAIGAGEGSVGGVSSVNGQQGDIKITPESIGAPTKEELENKIDKNGETEHLSINDTFKIDSLDGQGYVQLTVRGTEDNKDEVLNLDTLLGTDLRIVGIYKVVGDYDITNKKYVDDAIANALTTIDNAETLSF